MERILRGEDRTVCNPAFPCYVKHDIFRQRDSVRKCYYFFCKPSKLQVSTQLFDRALLNRNGVMDIWNMPHVEGGEKYYIRKEYTEVSELNNSDKEPKIIIQQVPQAGQQGTDDGKGKEPTEGEPKEPPDDGKQKEGVNNAD